MELLLAADDEFAGPEGHANVSPPPDARGQGAPLGVRLDELCAGRDVTVPVGVGR